MDIYGIIGWPVSHSLSPAMHNTAFSTLGIKAVYGLLPVEPKRLEAAIEGLRALGIKGVSVTVPHKERVMKYLDEVDEIAQEIGAVNTILNKEGLLRGTNTDWLGAKRALEEVIGLDGKEAVVVGAGGSARAIVYALVQSKAKVTIYNRTLSKAEALAEEFGAEARPLEELNQAKGNILVQTTSVGLGEDRSLVPKEILPRFEVVMDLVYVPLETKLLRQAKEAGCKVIHGLKMLVYQGVEQFRLWTGQEPPVNLMEEAALKALGFGERDGDTGD